jgi:hypothetical protein
MYINRVGLRIAFEKIYWLYLEIFLGASRRKYAGSAPGADSEGGMK